MSAKTRATYDAPTRVVEAIKVANPAYAAMTPPTWVGHATVTDDGQLHKLCRKVARGDPVLEIALRREWEKFREQERSLAQRRDDIVGRAATPAAA